MTKLVAEDYRSAPERSSHPLPVPLGSDFSRWWEQEPQKTLAGLGQPFVEVEDGAHILDRYLDEAGDDDDDHGNEPTRVLARSLLQMGPQSGTMPSAAARTRLAPESELVPLPQCASLAAPDPTLDHNALDEFARRVSQDSVLRKWMTVSSPRAAAPSLLIAPKIERTEISVTATHRPLQQNFEQLWGNLSRRAIQLLRARAGAAAAGLAVAALLSLFVLSRLGGTQANAAQGAPSQGQRVSLQARSATPPVLPAPVPAPAFITLRPGIGSDGALVELIGDGHLRQITELPTRVSASRFETYRVHARRTGYVEFSAELRLDDRETEAEVLIALEPVKPPLSVRDPLGARAPLPASQSADPVAAGALPVLPAKSGGETLVRVKADAKPLADGSAALSLNSIPISTVIVDGRTQGLTPRMLQVTPGVHTVVFVHSDLGRRLVSVDVTSGKTAVAAVKF